MNRQEENVKFRVQSSDKKVLFTLMLMFAMHVCFADNPFVRHIFTADPSARVWADGRLYVYPSHDVSPPQGCDLMDKYHVFSTDDMVHWVDHGEILNASEVSWGRPEGGFMWAPDCAYKNGIYYLYFPHPSGSGDTWNSTWKIGVATSTKPASDFTVQGYIPGLESLIDPCVFIDDDGQAYLYYGGGGVCKGGKLKDNMMEIDGTMQTMTTLAGFHEATWVHKYNGVYYLSFSDNNGQGGNMMRYATSNNPLGPWVTRGIYINSTGCDTDHGSIVEYKGQWYAFYHNMELSGNGCLRSICVDSLFYYPNGNIKTVVQTGFNIKTTHPVPGLIEAEDFNKGGEGVGYHDTDTINNGGLYRKTEGVDIQSCSEGGFDVYNTVAGEWLKYTIDVDSTATYMMDVRVSCLLASSFHVEFDGVGTGLITVPATGGSTSWKSFTVSGISLSAGQHEMRIYLDKGNLYINNVTLSLDSSAPVDNTISLNNNGLYVSSEDGTIPMTCNRSEVSPTETFTVVSAPGGAIALRGNNGLYVTSTNPMYCNGTSIVSATEFIWKSLGPDKVALKAKNSSSYICTEEGIAPMTCDRFEVEDWETFSWKSEQLGLGINDIQSSGSRVDLYPNPATTSINLTYTLNYASPVTVRIFNLQGELVKSIRNDSETGIHQLLVDIRDFVAGMYIIKTETDEFTQTKMFIAN
jgi:hypothetical protein